MISFREMSFLGMVGIEEQDGAVIRLEFHCDPGSFSLSVPENPILKRAFDELQEYLDGTRRSFTLPLAPRGTDFMRKVWTRLREIPYGETASYKEIAQSIGVPGGMRAVGLANNRNPIAVFIPCHRVIGADGSLVGYAGGLELKRQLLELERNHMPGRTASSY